MGLGLLDTPVRLTWDLHGPGQPPDRAAMLAIAGRMADAGVFFVTLEESPLLHPAIGDILAEFRVAGCQVQIACAGSEAELAVLETLPSPRPGVQLDVATFLRASHLEVNRLRSVFDHLCHVGVEPTLCLMPRKSNLHVISKLFDFCREAGAGRIKLPNARIGDRFRSIPPEDLPRWPELAAFREAWTRAAPERPAALLIEIHDRFIWEIVTPDCEQARSEYGGCQAANSLGHVDAAGTVYACAAWPEPLGTLHAASLDDIWQSPARFSIRERIDRAPAGCGGCRDYALCLGGCRGLGEMLNQDAGGRDLLCREPRC